MSQCLKCGALSDQDLCPECYARSVVVSEQIIDQSIAKHQQQGRPLSESDIETLRQCYRWGEPEM